ncbi:MAG: calcium-translocating P-type ATPase, SERCA-type [Acetivibrionales bacterium]
MAENNQIQADHSLYHCISIEETLSRLKSDYKGLSNEEALDRINKFGENELEEGKKKTILGMFIDQFKNVMIVILLVAAALASFMGELADTVIILFVILLNAILGVIQESKAEKALEALKDMSKPFSKVKRSGEIKRVKSAEIVPGDIVLIEAGDYVPADIRLIEVASLKIEEAALTGESIPTEKNTGIINKADTVIGDRTNMAFMGSVVTYGRGTGVVTGTGMNTEVGKIAGYLSDQETQETPLQKKLTEMGKYLSIGVVIITVIIFLVGILQGRRVIDMFLVAVSLAVAAIPEGLPAIVTIVLAIGVQRMSKNNAIIRKLPAVETLGSTEIICSDKTGTLTQNKMTVKELFFNNKLLKSDAVTGTEDEVGILMQVLTLCNDSKVTRLSNNSINTIGDPTETALVGFAAEKGFYKDEMDKSLPRKNELPFDSDRKLMTTINEINRNFRVFTKGAPDVLLSKCSGVLANGSIRPITEDIISEIKNANANMAAKALRVLALAYKDIETIPQSITSESMENGLIFVGLIGMIDPPRKEVKDAVAVCRKAGIKPVMITGDHRDTAAAIAKELEIINSDDEVITGSELDKISEEQLTSQVDRYSVYARVSPEHKVKIVKAWKNNGKVVAMTGDGVNDAPALKVSDIGVGMGITGTDVAKGVSDMILADDNFATIVLAVKQGRIIFSNIRKAIQFLLSANMGELITLFVATMLNWNILFPIHILWINLVTDTFPALALGVEKAEKDIMDRKPGESSASIFSGGLGVNIIYQGILEALITLATYYLGLTMYNSEATAITMAFITLGLIQLAHSLNVRSRTKSLIKIGIFSNKYLIGAIILSLFLQLVVIIVPQLNSIFRVTRLNIQQWLIAIIAALLIIPIVEIVKIIQYKSAR